MNLHLENFIFAFGFTYSDKTQKQEGSPKHRNLNLMKTAAYLPIIGPIFQIVVLTALILCKKYPNSEDKEIKSSTIVAFAARAAISPFVLPLPVLDGIGSILYAVKKKQNAGNDPLNVFAQKDAFFS